LSARRFLSETKSALQAERTVESLSRICGTKDIGSEFVDQSLRTALWRGGFQWKTLRRTLDRRLPARISCVWRDSKCPGFPRIRMRALSPGLEKKSGAAGQSADAPPTTTDRRISPVSRLGSALPKIAVRTCAWVSNARRGSRAGPVLGDNSRARPCLRDRPRPPPHLGGSRRSDGESTPSGNRDAYFRAHSECLIALLVISGSQIRPALIPLRGMYHFLLPMVLLLGKL